MKKSIYAILACGLAAAGCSVTHIKTPEWEATINSHWLKRDVDKLDVQRQADGGYSISLNGYKTDTSEQLPAFTREMWSGLAVLGRIASATINPAASQGAGPSPVLSSQSTSACKGGNCTDPACSGGNCTDPNP